MGEPAEALVELARLVFGFSTDTVYLSPGPIYHAAPLRFCGAVQALGGTVVMMKRFDAEQALQAIGEHRTTHAQFVPTMFVRMLQLPPRSGTGTTSPACGSRSTPRRRARSRSSRR